MQLNTDLNQTALVHAGQLDWVPSPSAGVDRRMLFRIGAEKARATSIVRYAPGSRFARHLHPGGEEFLVLEGVFQDESGDFPAGTYVRNPPGTAHAPGSDAGCTIFVRLWQFRADDLVQIVIRPGEAETPPGRQGVVSAQTLFTGTNEHVVCEDWSPDAKIEIPHHHGLEILTISGSVLYGDTQLERWSWLRLPAGTPAHFQAGAEGTKVWYKSAPPLHANLCPMPEADYNEDGQK